MTGVKALTSSLEDAEEVRSAISLRYFLRYFPTRQPAMTSTRRAYDGANRAYGTGLGGTENACGGTVDLVLTQCLARAAVQPAENALRISTGSREDLLVHDYTQKNLLAGGGGAREGGKGKKKASKRYQAPISRWLCYGMSGPIVLCLCYGLSGTDVSTGATRYEVFLDEATVQ
eukprot:732351-Rhodomonas_salina.1